MTTPVFADYAFALVLLVAASVFEYAYFWPRFRADLAAGKPNTRLNAYRRGVGAQWLFALAALAIWMRYGRDWSALRFTIPSGWRLGVAIAVVLAAAALVALQLWSVVRSDAEQRAAALPKIEDMVFLLPHTRLEEMWFLALSVTAGFCEELLYRGYLVWFFAPWIGGAAAMWLVVAVFGISHAYQGRNGPVK